MPVPLCFFFSQSLFCLVLTMAANMSFSVEHKNGPNIVKVDVAWMEFTVLIVIQTIPRHLKLECPNLVSSFLPVYMVIFV